MTFANVKYIGNLHFECKGNINIRCKKSPIKSCLALQNSQLWHIFPTTFSFTMDVGLFLCWVVQRHSTWFLISDHHLFLLSFFSSLLQMFISTEFYLLVHCFISMSTLIKKKGTDKYIFETIHYPYITSEWDYNHPV